MGWSRRLETKKPFETSDLASPVTLFFMWGVPGESIKWLCASVSCQSADPIWLCFWFGSSSWQTRSCKVGGMEVREMGTLSFSIRRLHGTQPELILSEKTFGTFLMIYSFYPLILKGSSFRQNPAPIYWSCVLGRKRAQRARVSAQMTAGRWRAVRPGILLWKAEQKCLRN